MKKTFLSSIHERRSVYSITNTSPIPKNKIAALIEMLLEDVPSAFNCQSARIVVLFEQAHKNFWDIVMRTLRERVPAENLRLLKLKSIVLQQGMVLFCILMMKALQKLLPVIFLLMRQILKLGQIRLTACCSLLSGQL